jgi:hypothetical protein
MTSSPTPIKNTLRLVLGIIIGAICGAVVASLILKMPTVRETVGVYTTDFEIVFGRSVGKNLFTVLKILGALAGAAVGGSLAVSVRWFAALGTLLVGIVIGGAIMFFVEVRVVKWSSGIWEDIAASERAMAYLAALRSMDRATTNQFVLPKFQATGRTVLSNYLHETESRMEYFGYPKHPDFLFTNSAAYNIVQKYLAAHTNALPVGKDF